MKDMLKKDFPELSKDLNILLNLPDGFPKCFQVR